MSAAGTKLVRATVLRSEKFAIANLEAERRTVHARIIQDGGFGKADRTNVRERRPYEQSYGVKFLRSKNGMEFKLCESPIIQDNRIRGKLF